MTNRIFHKCISCLITFSSLVVFGQKIPSAPDMGIASPSPGGSHTPGNPPPVEPPKSREGRAEMKKAPRDLLAGIIEDYAYVPAGKRDPFLPLETSGASGVMQPTYPLQSFDLDQLKLVGIIWDVRSPKAMLMDPTGKGYIVKSGERIGRNNGRISRIRENELIIVESFEASDRKVSFQTKVMRLQAE